jgi:hypothetical protein
MKKSLLLMLSLLLSITLSAQTSSNTAKADVILKLNGEEMKGKITKINDSDLTFIYSGETLEYTIKKSDILKITYASGRTEMVNKVPLPSETRQNDQVVMKSSPIDHHNKIAILPFHFLMDNQAGAVEVGLKAQQDTYSFLSQHAAGYTLLEPRNTNAVLAQAGITGENLTSHTMKEICDILGVEYVIEGTVTQNKAAETTSGYSNSDTKIKKNDGKDMVGAKSSNSNYSSTVQRFSIAVSLNIYMDTNANIYSQNHTAFLTSTDGSFSSPLQYLLKRSPLYRK